MITDNPTYPPIGIGKVSQPKVATIHLVQSSRFARRIAKLLIVALAASVIGMMFLPWQQTSRGSGQVVAYVPQERQQVVMSPVKGIVARIGKGLVEGSEVKKDDFILEVQPFAANMIEQLNAQRSELNIKLETALTKETVYGRNVQDFLEAQNFTVEAAGDLVDAASAKLESKQKQVAAYIAKELQARLNHDRQERLNKKGLTPTKELEKLKKEWDIAKAELDAIQEDVAALRKELAAKRSQLEEKRRIAQTKVDYARAMQQDAKGNAATIRKDIRQVEIKLEEMERRIIRAPRDGTIFRMPVYEQGQTIKEGDSILTLVPEISQVAVVLYVHGNDMPLVQVGQEVRLQFEGWPAVQFAGWPSVAIGTFSGVVANVDPTDNGKGKFRVMVLPLEEEGNEWPSERYLRQGVRANGWVLMRQVSLGYEIWRQLNGFPIIISDQEPDLKKAAKPPKLPK